MSVSSTFGEVDGLDIIITTTTTIIIIYKNRIFSQASLHTF